MSDLANELPRALERNEIVPYYQPLVDLQTSHVVGFEVLARWQHPVREVIHPAEFIPLAENCGLIGALTERLLRQACLEVLDWPAETELFVNLSPRQLRDTAMPERLHQLVEQARFPFHRLTFEITETAVVEDLELARAIIGNLRSLGARLAVDDFGTGFCGLRYLQVLPFDALKLDAAFVRSITGHRETRKIVAAVMGLCQSLGLAAIAEGVESQDQMEMLRSLGYRSGQGWLFGRPAPAAQASALLTDTCRRRSETSTAHIAEQVALRLEALPIQCLWQLRALYEGAPVGLAFVDHDLRYLAVNERLAEMHGCPVAAFLGRPVAEVIPERMEQVEPRIRRALVGEAVKDVKTRYRRDDGRVVVLQSSYQPVRDGAGEIVGVSVAVVEVTGEPEGPQRLELPVFRRA